MVETYALSGVITNKRDLRTCQWSVGRYISELEDGFFVSSDAAPSVQALQALFEKQLPVAGCPRSDRCALHQLPGVSLHSPGIPGTGTISSIVIHCK